jgi:hypothetical protein
VAFIDYQNKQARAIMVTCYYCGGTSSGVYNLTEPKLARKCADKWGPGRLRELGPQKYEWVRDGTVPKE